MNIILRRRKVYYKLLRVLCFALLIVFNLIDYTRGKEIKLIIAGVSGVIILIELLELFVFISENKPNREQEEKF